MPKTHKPIDPNAPLSPKREAFALAIAAGAKLQEAHKLAGFTGKSQQAAWELRNSPDVAARVRTLLDARVKAATRSFARRQKTRGDLLDRALSKLDDIMSTDVREIVDWRREPVLNAQGEVIDIAETMAVRDAADLSPKAASAIRGIFTKGGAVRVELHDQRAAAVEIVKLLQGSDAALPAANVTVNNLNIGSMSALDIARRVQFLLAKADAERSRLPLIEAKPVQVS